MGSIPMQSSLDHLNKWTEILQEILKYSRDGLSVYLLTLSPQKYSLGYELGSFKESRFKEDKVLINYFEQFNDALISQVAGSEEFSRGLLKIILCREQKSFDDLSFIAGDYENLTDELITCEDDGYSFYWYNSHLSKDEIEKKINAITSLVRA